MPTLQVVSDLHLELHADGGTDFIKTMDPTGVDALVLAGDIFSARFLKQTTDLFKRLSDKYPHVLYVPGNHEFWRTTPDETMATLGNVIGSLPNVTMLNNQVVVLNGRRFVGGPMWFPQWSPLNEYAATQMPDFKMIVDFRSWVVAENTRFQAFLKKNLKAGDVVLTHYLPSSKSIVSKYKGSALNAFFVCEMDQLIHDRKPALWVHGHAHESLDYQLFNTRIVCNPFGYPKELNPRYIEKMLIPIE